MMAFIIDPTFVRAAVLAGRTLLVEINGNHRRVTLGPPSPHTKLAASLPKRGAL
jgi:hypothetical protein